MKIEVSREEWERLHKDYKFIYNKNDYAMPKECKKFSWDEYYPSDSDPKYTRIMVSHEMKAWRLPTYGEFYGRKRRRNY